MSTFWVNEPCRQPVSPAERLFTKLLTLPDVSVRSHVVGCGVATGAAYTIALGADPAELEPAELVAVTVATIVDPTSAVVRT